MASANARKLFGTVGALGPKAWTALKPQALTELSESRPSEPGLEVLGSIGEGFQRPPRDLGLQQKPGQSGSPEVSELQRKNLSNA